jgi:hypothetical protein
MLLSVYVALKAHRDSLAPPLPAIHALEQQLEQCREEWLYIITGTGHHSTRSRAKLLPAGMSFTCLVASCARSYVFFFLECFHAKVSGSITSTSSFGRAQRRGLSLLMCVAVQEYLDGAGYAYTDISTDQRGGMLKVRATPYT